MTVRVLGEKFAVTIQSLVIGPVVKVAGLVGLVNVVPPQPEPEIEVIAYPVSAVAVKVVVEPSLIVLVVGVKVLKLVPPTLLPVTVCVLIVT